MRDYPAIADEIHSGFKQLARDLGGPTKAFHALMGGGQSAVYGVEALRAYDTFAGTRAAAAE
jgi:hypothetical protein